MSVNDRKLHIQLNRVEFNWLYRHLLHEKDKRTAVIKTYSGDAISKNKASEEQLALLKVAETEAEEITQLSDKMASILSLGDRRRLELNDVRRNLNDAFDLCDEESAKAEVMARLKALPKEEMYTIDFVRQTIKFTLNFVENDLHKFRSQVIPNLEKKDAGDFKDPIETKSYYLNRARRDKKLLEELKVKLERAL